jgi:hypothetical protein
MLSKLLALSSVSFANAAAGSASALCTLLVANCPSQFQAGLQPTGTVGVTECTALFNAFGWGAGTDDGKDSGNTYGCRQYYAGMANSTNQQNCKYAGITGSGKCGSVVTNACKGIVTACANQQPATKAPATEAACVDGTTADGLGALAAHWGSKIGPAAASENSLECRVYHALVGWNGGTPNAATDVHCNHTIQNAAVATVCDGAVSTDVEHHCNTIQTACTGGFAQYNDKAQCTASFTAFPDGTAQASNAANDRGCRQYHAQAAASGVGNEHCFHGGPSGLRVCGGGNGTRDSWRILTGVANCQIAANNGTWVKASVDAAFNNWARADVDAVIPASTANYTVAAAGDTEFCRLYHLTVASVDASHCEHGSIPSSTCFDGATPGVGAVCRMILAGCGTSGANSAYADAASCATAMTPVLARPGDGTTLTPAAADTFACRAFHAGAAITTKKAGGSVAASCANARAAAGPGCGGAAAKSDATTLGFSVAVALPLFFM